MNKTSKHNPDQGKINHDISEDQNMDPNASSDEELNPNVDSDDPLDPNAESDDQLDPNAESDNEQEPNAANELDPNAESESEHEDSPKSNTSPKPEENTVSSMFEKKRQQIEKMKELLMEYQDIANKLFETGEVTEETGFNEFLEIMQVKTR